MFWRHHKNEGENEILLLEIISATKNIWNNHCKCMHDIAYGEEKISNEGKHFTLHRLFSFKNCYSYTANVFTFNPS